VITIHNSSLAARPSGFTQPNPADFNKKSVPLPAANDQDSNTQATPVSTPEQIQAAIAKVGMTQEDNFFQGSDRRTNQALQAYNQTRNQPMQDQLETLIASIDTYA